MNHWPDFTLDDLSPDPAVDRHLERERSKAKTQAEQRQRYGQELLEDRPLRDLVQPDQLETWHAWLDTMRRDRMQHRRADVQLGRDPLRLVIDKTGGR